jgi:DNA-binding GntR family transcriptional regulator
MRETTAIATDFPVSDLISHRVAGVLQNAIRNGVLKKNDKIDELALAKQLSVSKTPVREALRVLEAKGLVEIVPRRGAFVKGFDSKTFADVANLRSVLDGLAVRLAMENADQSQWIAQLRRSTDDMRKSRGGTSLNELHSDFHRILTQASGNSLLNEAISRLQAQVTTFINVIHELYDDPAAMADEHDGVIDVIISGDAAVAEALVKLHVQEGLVRLQDYWKARVFDNG